MVQMVQNATVSLLYNTVLDHHYRILQYLFDKGNLKATMKSFIQEIF